MESVTTHVFRAMGCRTVVNVRADDDIAGRRLTGLGESRLRHLERCWTRFDSMSDISAINRSAGRAVRVDPSTIELVRAMLMMSRLTAGACQPAHSSDVDPSAIDHTRVDLERQTVEVASGVRLDPGSIGKGLAADLVARQLVDAGARGALVEVGGDLRATGDGPHHGFWSVAIMGPFDDPGGFDEILVKEAGVATSGLAVVDESGGPENVSVDPRRGRVLDVRPEGVVSATVVAGTAVEAEAWSTAMLVDGDEALAASHRRGCVARVVSGRGEVRATSNWHDVVTRKVDCHV